MQGTNAKPAILLILAWSVAVHIPGLFSPLRDYHAYRQTQTASMARNYVRQGMHFLTPEIDTAGLPLARAGTEFPIYSYLLAILFKFLGTREIFGRILSMVWAAWGAVFLYLLVRRRLGTRIALWSGLVMCTIPVHVYFTRTVQPEPMALWGFLGFLYYADRWLYTNPLPASWVCMVLLGALGPLLKLPFMYLVIPLWFYLGFEKEGGGIFKNMGWMLAMLCIVGGTFAWYHYARSAPVPILPLTPRDQIANLAPMFTVRLWRAQFISRIPELVTTYSGLLFALIGFYSYRRASAFSLLAVWSAACVVYVALLGEYGLIHRYTLLPLAPIAAIWMACGITAFWEHMKKNVLTLTLAVVLVLGIPVHTYFRIAHWYKLDYPYLPRAHATLIKVSKPTDTVLVASHETPETLYYLDRYGYGIEPNTWTPEDAAKFLHRGVRFVFIPIEDNKKTLPKWTAYLKTRARIIEKDPEYLLYKLF